MRILRQSMTTAFLQCNLEKYSILALRTPDLRDVFKYILTAPTYAGIVFGTVNFRAFARFYLPSQR